MYIVQYTRKVIQFATVIKITISLVSQSYYIKNVIMFAHGNVYVVMKSVKNLVFEYLRACY